ncbi:MAG TPA: hypothetical protein VGH34_20295 [Vicinamibacterales bacterium]
MTYAHCDDAERQPYSVERQEHEAHDPTEAGVGLMQPLENEHRAEQREAEDEATRETAA